MSYKSVFWHFRKWCKKGDWQESWFRILCKHKSKGIALKEQMPGWIVSEPYRTDLTRPYQAKKFQLCSIYGYTVEENSEKEKV